MFDEICIKEMLQMTTTSINMLDNALDVISLLDDRIRLYQTPALPLPLRAHAMVYALINQTSEREQMLDLIASLLDHEYFSTHADAIVIGIQHVLNGTNLRGYNLSRAVAALRSRSASAA